MQTGGCHVKYTKEQRLDIGRRIYDGELTRYEAAEEYGISEQTARDYMRHYRDANQLPPKRGMRSCLGLAKTKSIPVMARITEARLKKGYLVEGVGAEKTFIPIGRKNTK